MRTANLIFAICFFNSMTSFVATVAVIDTGAGAGAGADD